MLTVKKTLTALALAATGLLANACGHSYQTGVVRYHSSHHVVVHHVYVHHTVVHHVHVHH